MTSYEKVLDAMKNTRCIVGVDCTGVNEMLGVEKDHYCHIWVYEDTATFIPALRFETSLTEGEVCDLISVFEEGLWVKDDTSVGIGEKGVHIRYLSAKQPNYIPFNNPRQN